MTVLVDHRPQPLARFALWPAANRRCRIRRMRRAGIEPHTPRRQPVWGHVEIAPPCCLTRSRIVYGHQQRRRVDTASTTRCHSDEVRLMCVFVYVCLYVAVLRYLCYFSCMLFIHHSCSSPCVFVSVRSGSAPRPPPRRFVPDGKQNDSQRTRVFCVCACITVIFARCVLKQQHYEPM